MDQKAFTLALSESLPSSIVYHYKPLFEQILVTLTDYKTTQDLSREPNAFKEAYLGNSGFLNDFCSLVYANIDKSITSDNIATKLETINACDNMLIGCLEQIETFADKTGEFATQNKMTRRLLQNVMSFILYSLSQIATLNSALEQLLLSKSEEALIPFGFGE